MRSFKSFKELVFIILLAAAIIVAIVSVIRIYTADEIIGPAELDPESPVGRLAAAAYADLGYKETDDNITKFGKWYEENIFDAIRFAKAGDGDPWCVMALVYWNNEAGLLGIVPHTASTSHAIAWFSGRDAYYKPAEAEPEPGDWVFFSNDDGDPVHSALVSNVLVLEGKIVTISGNTTLDTALNANGDSVCEKIYALSDSRILGYGRPAYETQASVQP